MTAATGRRADPGGKGGFLYGTILARRNGAARCRFIPARCLTHTSSLLLQSEWADGLEPKRRLAMDLGGNLYGTTTSGGSLAAGRIRTLRDEFYTAVLRLQQPARCVKPPFGAHSTAPWSGAHEAQSLGTTAEAASSPAPRPMTAAAAHLWCQRRRRRCAVFLHGGTDAYNLPVGC